MVTKLRINFDFPAIVSERGHVDDVHSVVSDAVTVIARKIVEGDTAGDIRRPYFDRETDAWDSYLAATFDVVDENGDPITNLAEVV